MLQENGISFPEGSFATLVSAGGRLAVRNTQPNLDAVESFVESLFKGKGIENPNASPEVAAPSGAMEGGLASISNTANADRYLMEKMERIVFPSVQFSGASIEEAVEFCGSRARIWTPWSVIRRDAV